MHRASQTWLRAHSYHKVLASAQSQHVLHYPGSAALKDNERAHIDNLLNLFLRGLIGVHIDLIFFKFTKAQRDAKQ